MFGAGKAGTCRCQVWFNGLIVNYGSGWEINLRKLHPDSLCIYRRSRLITPWPITASPIVFRYASVHSLCFLFQSSKMLMIIRRLFSNRSTAACLTKLPTHILLHICSYLPTHAKGCLALTSKVFTFLLRDARLGLQFNPEGSMAGKPFNHLTECHHQRYIFLRLLEVDLRPYQFLCWDCFRLHPRTAFSEFNCQAEVRLSRQRGPISSRAAMFMSCSRDWRTEKPWFPEILAGIVDLCPCVKLTPIKKRRIEAVLRGMTGKDGTSMAPWHTCCHQYEQVCLEIKIWLYFKDSTSALTARIEYQRIGPYGWQVLIPRRYCPHQHLDKTLFLLSACHNDHEEDSLCATYQDLKRCLSCSTELIKAHIFRDPTSITVTHIACFERCLSDENWIPNTIYLPGLFARSERSELRIPS